jgi:hypothetical protein
MPAAKNKRRHKSFKVVDITESEPLSFEIGGEEFECYPEVQGKTLIDIMRVAAEGDEDTRGMLMAVSVLEFFKRVMPEDQYERFSALMDDRERIVSMETLSEIMAWLMEEYSERPTMQSSDS